jgi:hypothetical protein
MMNFFAHAPTFRTKKLCPAPTALTATRTIGTTLGSWGKCNDFSEMRRWCTGVGERHSGNKEILETRFGCRFYLDNLAHCRFHFFALRIG